MRDRMTFRSLLVMAALLVMSVAIVSATPAIAAKGGNSDGSTVGKGGGKGNGNGKGSGGGSTTAALELTSPNPCPLPCTASVHGTGWTPGIAVSVGIYGDYNKTLLYADASGTFDYTYSTTITWPGTYTFDAESADGMTATVTFTAE